MKAAVYKGKQRFAVEEIPTPVPGPGEVRIKVGYSAICGTDVHAFLYDVSPSGAVLGHEYSGTIDEVGPGVTRWKEGDRVMGGAGGGGGALGHRVSASRPSPVQLPNHGRVDKLDPFVRRVRDEQ